MAYYDDQDEEQKAAPVGGQATSPESSIISPASAGSGAQAPAAASTASATPTSPQTSKAPTFVGIQDYINANKPQTTKLVSGIDADIQNKGLTAANAQRTAQSDYVNQVSQGVSGTGPYKGPTQAFEDTDAYKNAQKQAQDAQTAAAQVATPDALNQLLANKQAATHKGMVNQGALSLDNSLIAADPTNASSLQHSKQYVDNLDLNGAFSRLAKVANTNRVDGIAAQAQRTELARRAAADAAAAEAAKKKGQPAPLTLAQVNTMMTGRPAPSAIPSSVKGLAASYVPTPLVDNSKNQLAKPTVKPIDLLMKEAHDKAAAQAKENQIALERKQKAEAKAKLDADIKAKAEAKLKKAQAETKIKYAGYKIG